MLTRATFLSAASVLFSVHRLSTVAFTVGFLTTGLATFASPRTIVRVATASEASTAPVRFTLMYLEKAFSSLSETALSVVLKDHENRVF